MLLYSSFTYSKNTVPDMLSFSSQVFLSLGPFGASHEETHLSGGPRGRGEQSGVERWS